jgi:L-methionine (R)-S-oxide reductase
MDRKLALRLAAIAAGALALGAVAVGAVAIGTLAIARLAIGKLAIRRVTIADLHVGALHVGNRMEAHRPAVDAVRDAVEAATNRSKLAENIAAAIRTSGRYRWVGIYDVGSDEIGLIACSGPTEPAHPSFPVTQGLNGEAVRLCETVVSNDVAQDPRYLTTFESSGSELIVPVIDADGRAIGTIDVESDRIDAFDANDVRAIAECTELVRRALFT